MTITQKIMPRIPQLSKEERLRRKRERDRLRRIRIQNDDEARQKRNRQAAEAKRNRRFNIQLQKIEQQRNNTLLWRRECERDAAAIRKRRENEYERSLERERDANAKRLRKLDLSELKRLLKQEIALESISNERRRQVELEIARRMMIDQEELDSDEVEIIGEPISITTYGYDFAAEDTDSMSNFNKTDSSDLDSSCFDEKDVFGDIEPPGNENMLEPVVTILIPTIKLEHLFDETEDPLKM